MSKAYNATLNRALTTLCDFRPMTGKQVAMLDSWANRAAPILIAAAILGGFVMWGDVSVIKEKVVDFAADLKSVEEVNASQAQDIEQIRRRLLLLERDD